MSQRFERRARVSNRQGIHARPSALIVQTANKFSSEIRIDNPAAGTSANAKSMMDVMMLVAPFGTDLTIHAEGADAELAVQALVRTIEGGFAET